MPLNEAYLIKTPSKWALSIIHVRNAFQEQRREISARREKTGKVPPEKITDQRCFLQLRIVWQNHSELYKF